jgi:TPP-dependent 2-oxoacid decarboxylase
LALKMLPCAQHCFCAVLSMLPDTVWAPHPLQEFLEGNHVVLADTGDCMFWTQRLKLPAGAGCDA